MRFAIVLVIKNAIKKLAVNTKKDNQRARNHAVLPFVRNQVIQSYSRQ
jgi:hypothetical protein